MTQLKAKTRTYMLGNIWIRHMEFPTRNSIKKGHIHSFDHITLVARGSVEAFDVKSGNSLGVYTSKIGENLIRVPAGMAHSIVAKEDNSLAFCIQAIRDKDTEEVIQTDFNNPRWVDPKTGVEVITVKENIRAKGM